MLGDFCLMAQPWRITSCPETSEHRNTTDNDESTRYLDTSPCCFSLRLPTGDYSATSVSVSNLHTMPTSRSPVLNVCLEDSSLSLLLLPRRMPRRPFRPAKKPSSTSERARKSHPITWSQPSVLCSIATTSSCGQPHTGRSSCPASRKSRFLSRDPFRSPTFQRLLRLSHRRICNSPSTPSESKKTSCSPRSDELSKQKLLMTTTTTTKHLSFDKRLQLA
mmetsp:Transcript_370/g.689  ORF Transcript_370/g.689 Transcript_370/m.689 type:complete len:220 (-) Transcript_370:151-810(-)